MRNRARVPQHQKAPRERVRPAKPKMTIREELDYIRDRAWFHGESHHDRQQELITMLKEGHPYE